MNRKLIFVLAAALTLAVTATAWAGSFSQAGYQGRIESDRGTFFGFDIAKKNGVKRVKNIEALPKLQCDNGQTGQLDYLGKGSLRVHDNGTFRGTLRGRNQLRGGAAGPQGKMIISGKLQKGGKARGRVDATYVYTEVPVRGAQPERVRCYSGDVDWKVKRGAIVNPEFQARRLR